MKNFPQTDMPERTVFCVQLMFPRHWQGSRVQIGEFRNLTIVLAKCLWVGTFIAVEVRGDGS